MNFRAHCRAPLLAILTGLLAACQTLAPVSPATKPLPPPPGMTAQTPGAAAPPLIGAPPTPATLAAAASAAVRAPRLGLALGGGAARGFAHIGVIQVLEENGIKADLVVGTSAGSLVAALYASGRTGLDMGTLAQTMDEGAITDWAFPSRGLIRGEALARYVTEQTRGLSIEQMKMPLGIVATDLDSGAGVLFRRGDTGVAVRASSAVPAVFQPVKIGSREYVDGGLVSPVPVRYARQMGADLVLAVDISNPPEGAVTSDLMKMLLQTFAIMSRSISQFELREADFVLRPALAGVSSADFTARRRAIIAGREAALKVLPELRARIAAWTQRGGAPQ